VILGGSGPARARGVRAGALALLVLIGVAGSGWAETLDDRVNAVAQQLMCPVCAGQTVAESDSSLAREMRAIIRQKLLAGATPAEILRYFVSQFGESVLAEPPRRGVGLVLYAGPLLAVAGGLLIAVLCIRRWAARAVPAASSLAPARRSGGTVPSSPGRDRFAGEPRPR
jgi:cytochrome c-type biogenesis protein CcmH/NrfF